MAMRRRASGWRFSRKRHRNVERNHMTVISRTKLMNGIINVLVFCALAVLVTLVFYRLQAEDEGSNKKAIPRESCQFEQIERRLRWHASRFMRRPLAPSIQFEWALSGDIARFPTILRGR